MEEIIYTQIFGETGIYRENGSSAMLAVLSGPYPGQTVTITEALKNKAASFVYCEKELKTAAQAEKLLDDCRNLLEARGAERGILWFKDSCSLACIVADDFSRLSQTFRTTISGTKENGIDIRLGAGMRLCYASGILEFSDLLYFSFGEIYMNMRVHRICLHLCGDKAGMLDVTMTVSGSEFNKVFSCGFEYGFLNQEHKNCLVSSRLYDGSSFTHQTLYLQFSFGFRICSSNRVYFLDSNVNILSNFITIHGDRIFLVPVIEGTDSGGMSFPPRISENVNCVPYGKYQAAIERSTQADTWKLLCGFCGTEYILMKNKGILKFTENQNAFSAFYPPKGISIADFVGRQPEHRLSEEMVTAGAVFYGKYYSQPVKAPFFTGNNCLLSLAETCIDCSDGSPAVPLMPYKDVKIHVPGTKDVWADETQASEYEKQILMTERRICIANACANGHIKCSTAGMNPDAVRIAAPSGFIAEIAGTQFTKITIAFSPGGNLFFSDITDMLRTAFLDPAMFCVFADISQAGALHNNFSIDGWQFTLTPGAAGSLNDYANILIIKGAKGKMYDPEDETAGLCGNTGLWTCRDSFSIPAHGETANLANWLQNYCKKAYDSFLEGDMNFEHFAGILTDADWKGILMLNVSVEPSCFPDCLKPLLNGMEDDSLIHAHHIGTELATLKAADGGPQNESDSPFFGLIHYTADGFTGAALPAADSESVYEFKLLELKTVFEKGAVKDFHSVSQLVLGEIMALKPSSGGCLYNALLLNGSLQDAGGHSALVMDTEGGAFCFQNAPVSKIDITGITLETVHAETMDYAFHLSGSIAFPVPSENRIGNHTWDSPAMDLMSYDSLLFTDYCLHLTNHAFQADTGSLVFDLSHSVLREQSICRYFGMTAASMRMGTAVTEGFQAVAAEHCSVTAKLEGHAAGIVFSVKLGGLGGLSAGASLTADLLLAWDNSNHLYLGMKLPGSSMIDGVLGITFGNARLLLREGKPVLYLPKTSLQLLGFLSLPPNGAFTLAMEGNGDGIGWFGVYKK